MRDLPIFSSGDLATSTTKTAHLYEVELAKVKVMAAVSSGSSYVIVDDIDKCFVGQLLVFGLTPASSTITSPQQVEVAAISPILNQITLTAPLEYDLAYGSYLYETLQASYDLPEIQISAGATSTVYRLQLWHSAFGSLCGRMLFTDFDVPIVAALDDGVFSPEDNYGVFIPYPIQFGGTSYDTHGKMSNITLNVANIDQRFSNIVLTHDGLRKRKIKVHTVYLNDALPFNLNVPVSASADVKIIAGMTSGSTIMPTYNSPFYNAYFDVAEDKVQEFEGFIDSITMDSKEAALTCVNYIDSSDDILIPRNLYTRGRCQFVYKGQRCRFRSTLYTREEIAATATTTTFQVIDTEGKFPLYELQDGETHIIQIGQEQMLVTAVSSGTYTKYTSQETHHQTQYLTITNFVSTNPEWYRYNLTVTRQYNGTAVEAHAIDSFVDLLLCRKTFRDCRLHFHERLFGGFPAIPKQIYNA